MLIFLYGADTYRSRERLRELITAFQKKHDPDGVNLVKLDGQRIGLDELAGAIRSQPFLGGGKRMVAVERLLEKKSKDTNGLIDLLSKVPESTVVIIWEATDSESAVKNPVIKKFHKDKSASCYAFDPLKGPSLTKWIKDEVKRARSGIETRAVEHLVEHAGDDLWRLHGEMEKLLAYRQGQEIRVEDVELLTEGTAEENIFAILDALSERKTAAASQLIRQQIAGGGDPTYLLAMLLRQVRILTAVRSYLSGNPRSSRGEVAENLGLHPFVAEKAMATAKTFSPALLVSLLQQIFEAERGIRTGRLAPPLAIEQLLTRVALG